MKINSVQFEQNNISLKFKAKVPVNTLANLGENTIKTASAAAAAVGLAGILMSQKEDKSEDDLIKKVLSQYIGRETYIVVKDNFLADEKQLQNYISYKVRMLFKDCNENDYIKSLVKELVLERINDKSKPDDFSEIGFSNNKKIKYADVVLAEEMLRYYVDKGYSYHSIANHTGCSYKQVLERSKKYQVTSERQQNLQKVAQITKEKAPEIAALVKSGASLESLCGIYNVSVATMLRILDSLKLQTDGQKKLEKVQSISMEKIVECWAKGMTTIEIAKFFGCSPETISQRLDKLGLQTKRQSELGKWDDILTEDAIKECLSKKMNTYQMAEFFGCSTGTIRRRLNRFELATEHQIRNRELVEISREEILECLEKNMSLLDMANYFKCSSGRIRNKLKLFEQQTKQQASRAYNLENVTDEALQECVKKGMSLKQMTEYFGCNTNDNIRLKLARANLKTKYAMKLEEMKGLKHKITALIAEGKNQKEISETLGISVSTIKNYLNYQKSLSDEQLSVEFMELFINNSNLYEETELVTLVDTILNEIHGFSDKKLLKDFIKKLNLVVSGSKNLEDIMSSELVNNIYNELDKIEQEKSKTEDVYNEMYDIIQDLAKTRQDSLISICTKYLIKDKSNSTCENCKYIINAFYKDNTDTFSLERELVYWDCKNDSSDLISEAEEYAKEADGTINPKKAGQYIINANILSNLINKEQYCNYSKSMQDVIKTSNLPTALLIRFLIKIEDWQNSDNKTSMRSFLNEFSPNDGEIENRFIKSYIEELYLNTDTELQCTFDNKQKHTVVLTSKVKREIYNYYKYPNCLNIFTKFETAMTKPARDAGTPGIKQVTSYYEVKIKGVGDRLFSSEENKFIFDKFVCQHAK